MAFRAASGDYLASTVTGNHRPRFATFARPTDATGTKGDFKGEVTGIVASFDFTPENPQVKLDTRTLGHFGHPIPRGAHPWQASVAVCLGCPWDPVNASWPLRLLIENLTNLGSGPVYYYYIGWRLPAIYL